jgi:hypothetical protein
MFFAVPRTGSHLEQPSIRYVWAPGSVKRATGRGRHALRGVAYAHFPETPMLDMRRIRQLSSITHQASGFSNTPCRSRSSTWTHGARTTSTRQVPREGEEHPERGGARDLRGCASSRFCAAEGLEKGGDQLDRARSRVMKVYGVEVASGPLTSVTARGIGVLDESCIARRRRVPATSSVRRAPGHRGGLHGGDPGVYRGHVRSDEVRIDGTGESAASSAT